MNNPWISLNAYSFGYGRMVVVLIALARNAVDMTRPREELSSFQTKIARIIHEPHDIPYLLLFPGELGKFEFPVTVTKRDKITKYY